MKKLFFKKNTSYLPLQSNPLPSLGTCLLMDLIGSASILIPVVGELVWAPISAFIFWRMFGFRKGFFGGIFSFIEELIPGIDFIPTFTIMWFIQYARNKKTVMAITPVNR
ncbi:MAG TPA: hypothetical protein VGO09_03365 [Flavisolibacter sp.]|jgi:hypothetical protein|nr:hypothetical protein [Flavisolibacter sp.]